MSVPGKMNNSLDMIFSHTEDIFRRLVENAHMGFFITDASGGIIYANHALVELLKYNTKEELVGLNLKEILFSEKRARDRFTRDMQRTGFVKEYEMFAKGKNDEQVVLSLTCNYIRDEKEKVIGLEGLLHDISHQIDLKQTHRLFTKAVRFTADNIMITDKEGVIQYVNPAFERTTGYNKEEVIGKDPSFLKSGKHGKKYYQDLWSTILAGKVFKAQTTNKNKEGKFFVAEQTISPIKNAFDEITHFVSVWRDITEKQKLEEQLVNERRKLEEIVGFDEKVSTIRKFDGLIDFIVTKATDILEANKCTLMLVDEHTGELFIRGAKGVGSDIVKNTRAHLGKHLAGIVAQEQEAILVTDVATDRRFKDIRLPSYLGTSFVSVPINLDEKLLGLITVAEKKKGANEGSRFDELDLKILMTIAREIAVALENIKLYKELNYLVVIDPLTGIHNYRYFTKSLDYEIRRAKRFNGMLSLLMIDVDDFKDYNDKYGHLAGNKLLKMVGKSLQKNLREIDVLCRYAGDEFVVILPETDLDGANFVGKRLTEAIKKLKLKRKVTVSIGISRFIRGMTRHDLTAKADRALYQAKKEGKNKVCYYG